MSAPAVRRASEVPLAGAGERRSAVRGVAWGGIESATGALVGFLLTPLIVRVAGIDGLGLWAASWSLAHTAGILDLGVGGSYARFTARAIATGDRDALNGAVGAGFGFHLVLSCLVAVAAIALMPLALARVAPRGRFAAQAAAIMTLTLAVVLLRLTLSAYRGVVAGAQRLDLLGRIGAATSLLEGAGGAAVLLGGGGLRGLAVNSLGAAAVACLAEGAVAHHLCPGLRLNPFGARRSDWREVLSFGLRLQVTRGAEILANHAPRLALALGPGLLSAGAYDLGARAAGALQLLGALPLPVIQPLASRLEARGDRARLRSLVERATRYVALLVLPGAALLVLEAPAILIAWTGRPVPEGAATGARWLAAAAGVSLLVSPARLALRGIGRPGLEAWATTCGSIVNLLLALALALRFGAPGVALAALSGSIVAAAALSFGGRRGAVDLVQGTLRRALPGPCIAGVAALLSGAAARLIAWDPATDPLSRLEALRRLLPEAGLVPATFLLAAILAGGLRREDLRLFRDAVPARDQAPAAGGMGGGG